MTILFRSVFLTLLAAGAGAGETVIEGVVVSARSGAALKNATVQLRQIRGGVLQRVATSLGGRFVFHNVAPGRYRLSAERRGYVPQEYGSPGPGLPGETIEVEASQHPPPVVIRLSPLGVIAGRVLDEDGEPVADVTVHALQYVRSRTGSRLVEAKLARTDDLGEYRFYGLSPGRYFVSAEYPAWESEASGNPGGAAYAPTYYPGTSDPAGAAALDVTPASESLGVDFALRKTLTVRVSGRVTGIPARLSPEKVNVILIPRGFAGLSLMKNARAQEPSGDFEMEAVVPGSYVLAAYTVEGAPRHFGLQPVELGPGDAVGISVSLSPGIDVVGRVRVDGELQPSLAGLAIFLRPRIPLPTGGFSGRSTSDGILRIPGVAAGEYDVEVSGIPEGCYLKSLRFGGEEALSLQPGRPPAELEVVLGADGGRLDGSVSNERQEAVPEAFVVLTPVGGHPEKTGRIRSATADQNGRFRLTDIPPGDYRLFAWEEPVEADFSRIAEKGTDVTIQANGRLHVQLRTIK